MSTKASLKRGSDQDYRSWIFEKDAPRLVLDVVSRMPLPTALDEQTSDDEPKCQRINTLVEIAINTIDACYEQIYARRNELRSGPENRKTQLREVKNSAAEDKINREKIVNALQLTSDKDKVSFAKGRAFLCGKSGRRDREMTELKKILENAYEQRNAFFQPLLIKAQLNKTEAIERMLQILEKDGFNLFQICLLLKFADASVKSKLGILQEASTSLQHPS